jgi:hypothetical protein
MKRKVLISIELRDGDHDLERRIADAAEAAVVRAFTTPSLDVIVAQAPGPVFCRPAHSDDTSALLIVYPAQ